MFPELKNIQSDVNWFELNNVRDFILIFIIIIPCIYRKMQEMPFEQASFVDALQNNFSKQVFGRSAIRYFLK